MESEVSFLASTEVWTADHPARSESLQRLHYSGPFRNIRLKKT
jgi:hypothetical protein